MKRPVPYIQKIEKIAKKSIKFQKFTKIFFLRFFQKIIKICIKILGTKNYPNFPLPTKTIKITIFFQ